MRSLLKRITAVVLSTTALAGVALRAQDTVVLDGSTTVGPIAKAFAEYYMENNPGVNVTVSESGSGNGAKGLINSTCDIGNMSRFMKENEFAAAVAAGAYPVAHVVAMDGLPVLVHPSNPVSNLTVAQIRGIYSGKISNWKAVGGPDMDIVVISRDTNSGTYETFLTMVMTHRVDGQKVEEEITANAEYVGSNGQMRARVQNTRSAIGYAGLGFVDRTVKALTVDGIEANPATVRSGKYPIARPLYMFTNGYPKLGSHVHGFVTIHLTPKGQEIVESIGFVPVTSY
jgi:phosphate transport system substrate-binding protein